ncbi:50S ribosomal protein L11 [Candidatus Bandiella euplotis]|uniref:Large ribosomal subunit protein uL11 n=1 Tax=Candidatus Bandiella euplotis TaxID=1664265 RepID=A0ABZ0UIU3_9RICK|nr:50S ribosomal protein L11 [Candidatus Bandiella woodruffii]WPX96006.1 50S ribosomal protein L11 [Candidatus Bandiella woodruffii]
MKKKAVGEIKLQILAGKANPAPPIGPALGQKGLNIAEFCKQFNDRTKNEDPNMKMPVIITAYADRSFSFIVKAPPVADLIRKYAGLQKGSSTPGRTMVGSIKKEDVVKIAEIKLEDIGVDKIESATKVVEGTARSMGVKVVD